MLTLRPCLDPAILSSQLASSSPFLSGPLGRLDVVFEQGITELIELTLLEP